MAGTRIFVSNGTLDGETVTQIKAGDQLQITKGLLFTNDLLKPAELQIFTNGTFKSFGKAQSFSNRYKQVQGKLIDLGFQPHFGPVSTKPLNRSEYQISSWVIKGGRRVRLASSPSVS